MAGRIEAEGAFDHRSSRDIDKLIGACLLIRAGICREDDGFPAELRQVTDEPQRALHRAAPGKWRELKGNHQYAFHLRRGFTRMAENG